MARRTLYYALLAAVGVGLAAGVISAAAELSAQGYLEQRLYRLALRVVIERVNVAIVWCVAAALAAALAAIGAAAAGPAFFRRPPFVRAARRLQPLGSAARGTATVAVALVALLQVASLIDARRVAVRPNVLLIVVDTLRADHVGAYGYTRNTTPHLDHFARQALLFRHAHAVSPWTTPSVAAMLTSRYPNEVSWRHPPVPLAKRLLSLPELLADRGYATAAVVSHLYVAQQLGFAQGFDSYDQASARGHGYISSPSVTEKALGFLEQGAGEPFFLFVHYFDPHSDFLLHPGFDFDPDYDGPLRPDMTLAELRALAPTMSARDLDYVRALYDSEIRFTDEQIGRLLRGLRERSLWEDTLVIVTADHGEEFCERGDHYIGHGTHVHQELVHVPLLIKPPGRARGVEVESWISLLDLAPTIAQVAGGPPSVPAFRGTPLELRTGRGGTDPVLAETGNKRAALSRGWKLMSVGEPPVYRLFHLESDPGETRDVLAEHPGRARPLRQALEAWAGEPDRRAATTAVFTAEERDQLRALGYVD